MASGENEQASQKDGKVNEAGKRSLPLSKKVAVKQEPCVTSENIPAGQPKKVRKLDEDSKCKSNLIPIRFILVGVKFFSS